MSYGALAAKLGVPKAMRAVGHANGSNPISVVVPCHRLIGADGALVKYGGGLERKRWLLEHEGVVVKCSRAACELVALSLSRSRAEGRGLSTNTGTCRKCSRSAAATSGAQLRTQLARSRSRASGRCE